MAAATKQTACKVTWRRATPGAECITCRADQKQTERERDAAVPRQPEPTHDQPTKPSQDPEPSQAYPGRAQANLGPKSSQAWSNPSQTRSNRSQPEPTQANPGPTQHTNRPSTSTSHSKTKPSQRRTNQSPIAKTYNNPSLPKPTQARRNLRAPGSTLKATTKTEATLSKQYVVKKGTACIYPCLQQERKMKSRPSRIESQSGKNVFPISGALGLTAAFRTAGRPEASPTPRF